jgi:hypothetical protein
MYIHDSNLWLIFVLLPQLGAHGEGPSYGGLTLRPFGGPYVEDEEEDVCMYVRFIFYLDE